MDSNYASEPDQGPLLGLEPEEVIQPRNQEQMVVDGSSQLKVERPFDASKSNASSVDFERMQEKSSA